jgi:hypothetical protein
MGANGWVVLAAALVGGGVSLLTTWLNAFIVAKTQRAKDAREDAAIRAAVMSLLIDFTIGIGIIKDTGSVDLQALNERYGRLAKSVYRDEAARAFGPLITLRLYGEIQRARVVVSVLNEIMEQNPEVKAVRQLAGELLEPLEDFTKSVMPVAFNKGINVDLMSIPKGIIEDGRIFARFKTPHSNEPGS